MIRRTMLGTRSLAVLLAASALMASGCFQIGPAGPGNLAEVMVRRSGRFIETNRVAIIDVQGFIGVEGGWLSDGTTVADVREKLEDAAKDGAVRAIVLRIDTPGGGAAASDMIYRDVLRFKEDTKKPVVAALMDTAASGGYYVALAADKIVANPSTITGSVGVIMHVMNVETLLRNIGVSAEAVKSGDMKDIGSVYRQLRPEDREMLQGVVDDMFGRFLGAVRTQRKSMTDEDLRAISDGRILTAAQAQDLHAIDSIGYLDDALDEAIKLAGLESADVILYRVHPHYNSNIYAGAMSHSNPIEGALKLLLRRASPTFLYLWSPGL